ncbi:MAG: ABC-F family ATP-binding cassette domain-containing protein [Bacteroidaceae bacterium]|nr:ABC-F family ATP-binding cassette domain-containing protein [Bacteroidaceae bacterium]
MPTPYLQVENLTKSFGSLMLFENISFGVAQGQRIGLIAKNGTGKSTLLDILAGKEGYDSGKITYRNGIRIGYLPQTPVFPEEKTIAEICPGIEAEALLHSIGINDLTLKADMLSGGQRKRIAIAQVLVDKPDFLLLDEPTNHLDLSTIEWLEDQLSHSTCTLLMVTHDRYFLDRVCSTILELDDNTIYTYKGNYSYYLEKRQQRIDARNAEIARANNLYRTELDWMRRMPCARGHKARYREEAFYELEKVAKQNIRNEQVQLKGKAGYIGNKIFELDDVSLAFDSSSAQVGQSTGKTVILSHFSYTFSRYEKLGIVGDNGTGKTSFLRLLLREIEPDSGSIDIGSTVRFGCYSQTGLQFNEQQKVIDVVRDIAEYIPMSDGSSLSASQLLQDFLFPPQKQYSYVYKLSGGEKRRLYLCTVLMRNPNFLILDEPTNDLDILTLQILEEYLQNWKGCLIVVSHDRYFMDKMVDHLLVFNGNGDIRDFPGNCSQYREWKAMEEEHRRREARAQSQPSQHAQKGTQKKETDDDKPRKMSYKEKREFEQLETEIAELEKEKKLLEDSLCSGKLSIEEITAASKRLPVVNDAIDEKSMRWLELSELTC